MSMRFPPGFVFGAATSAYQIEGAADEDGRGPSIWDTFAAVPGAVRNGDTGAIACDHYHRVEADLDLAAGLGLTAYRFSIAWPRIIPDGAGAVNQKGLDFYRRLLDGLHARGIEPVATLYHWDLPQPLQDAGGWASRGTVDRFCDYAQVVLDNLGDAVGQWVTINEAFCAAMIGHLQGRHAPGLRDLHSALAAAHHLLLAHGAAVPIVRGSAPAAQVGLAHLFSDISPASSSAEDQAAARRLDGHENRWFLDPVCPAVTPPTCWAGTSGRCRSTSSGMATWRSSAHRPTSSASTTTRPRWWRMTQASPTTRPRCCPATGRLTAGGLDMRPAGLGRILRRVHDTASCRCTSPRTAPRSTTTPTRRARLVTRTGWTT